MQNKISPVIKLCLALSICISSLSSYGQITENKPEFRNFYGISWRGTVIENLSYARQMGYNYVFYQKGMEKEALSNGLYFYIETPEYSVYNRRLDTKKKYSAEEIRFCHS